MKKRLLALTIILAMLVGLFAACADQAERTTEPMPADAPTENVEPYVPREDEPPPTSVTDGNPDAAKGAIVDFSQTLFREVLAQGENNPVISPLSAYYALAMAALGAGGEIRAAFEAVLGRDPETLARDLRTLTQQLTGTSGSTELNIAGSVWTDEDFTIDPTFARAMADYFDALALSRDFGAPRTVDEINTWVAERTEGLIEELIESIDPEVFMLLINTLYFSARWAEAFNPMTEYQGVFHPDTGGSIEAPFLTTGRNALAVSVTDTYEAVMLPYDDGRLGFLIARPTDGTSVRDFAASQDLGAMIAGLELHDEVQVHMPKLDLEFEIRLNDQLKAMGLEDAFDPDLADFSGLLEEDCPLWIGFVLQKVRLLVDEEGTEAAAATAVAVFGTSFPLDLIELIFDTPYLYAIYDLETGIPLFMGVLDNPA